MVCRGIATVFFVALAVSPLARAAEPPNFVFILADDQGWTSSSVVMNPHIGASHSDFYETPNLERLAKAGMRFTQGYAPAGMCCPSRRSIQFGQTPVRQGNDEQFAGRYPIGNKRPTIPRLLKAIDPRYAAAHFGKWDLRTELAPEHLGYDESDGITGNSDGNCDESGESNQIAASEKWTDYSVLQDPKRVFSMTERGIGFMRRMTAEGRPFFLQLSHYAVHATFQARRQTLARWQSRPPGQVHRNEVFAAMMADLDAGIGMVLDELRALGILDRTFILYMADNGGVATFPPDVQANLANPQTMAERGMNFPLRSGKWTVYEGGIRVPFVIRGPGICGGTACDVPVVGWDLLPTIADLAGYRGELPADLDGVSFRELLTHPDRTELRRPGSGLIFNRDSQSYGHAAIRCGDYKLVRYQERRREECSEPLGLFDLSVDPGEMRNLADELPEKAGELEAELRKYYRDVQATFP